MKLFKVLIYITSILSINLTNIHINKRTKVSVIDFGAKGDGKQDDTKAVIEAIDNADTIIIPKGTYNIMGVLKFENNQNKTIIAIGAIIKNISNTVGTLEFDQGKNISIIGGTWQHQMMPTKEGPVGNEHTFQFVGVSSVKVQNTLINGSPQMGICMIGVIGGIIKGNTIQNCFRDGIYSHYSAKLNITGNHLDNIKDDAISMHDYGIVQQKPELLRSKFKQAGHSVISNNSVHNAFQGFSSIGCEYLVIEKNDFKNTINAGIAIFNSTTLFKGSTAYANHITIQGNKLDYNGGKQVIMGKIYQNGGQLSTGRSAILVSALDNQNLINHPQTKISSIIVQNNIITNSYVNGAYLGEIDDLIFKNNSFTNCDIDQSKFSGRIVEISNCTKVRVDLNKVVDTRSKVMHDAGYQLKNVSGVVGKWIVKGYRDPVSGYVYNSIIN